jgi:hypothetical protein
MITACTVLLNSDVATLGIWIESLSKNTSLISELLIADINPKEPASKIQDICAPFPCKVFPVELNITPLFDGHAAGLHECIQHASNDLLLLTDNDVFYYRGTIDRFLLDVRNTHGTQFTGVSHYRARTIGKNDKAPAYGWFPTLITLLVSKKDLPPADFLSGQLWFNKSWKDNGNDRPGDQADGKWLLKGPIKPFCFDFPNSGGTYDTGCNLYTWSKRNSFRWISFAVAKRSRNLFKTENFNNINLDRLTYGNKRLMYHQSSSQYARRISVKRFKDAYAAFGNEPVL